MCEILILDRGPNASSFRRMLSSWDGQKLNAGDLYHVIASGLDFLISLVSATAIAR